MRKQCISVLIGLSLFVAGQGLAVADENEEAPGYTACMQNAMSTSDIIDCSNEAYVYWDKQLNINYRAALKNCEDSPDTECKAKLKKAQRAWLAYRDGMASYLAVRTGGTIDAINVADFLMSATKEQARKLR